jgi:hypothetical protein
VVSERVVTTFNNAQKVLPDEDCLHKEGPLMVIGFVKQSESGSFVRHGKRRWENDGNGLAKTAARNGQILVKNGNGGRKRSETASGNGNRKRGKTSENR